MSFPRISAPSGPEARWLAAHKQLFSAAARETALHGATAPADAVRGTLGPKSKCVLIERKYGRPLVCNDGVTIAKVVDLKDPEEDFGATMIREAAERTDDAVGDGTGTPIVPAHTLFADGLEHIAAGPSPSTWGAASTTALSPPWPRCAPCPARS